MEKAHEALGEAKAEIEKLRSECKHKTELVENLKRAYNEQLSKLQEAKFRIEKQTQELNEKADEATEAEQACEDLKRSLRDKESIIKQLTAANDKLRSDYDAKFRTWEEEKKELVLALEEANEQTTDQEQKIYAFKGEIECLKQLLSASQKKCLEVEKKAKAARESRERDDMFFNLEEQNRKVEDQLKWKKEQFKHLEEAHEKLREQFKVSKKEWEAEKCTLVDEIYSLQTRLDSQTRTSEDLQKRLQMCNQALAHEESRRKYLEIQVSEFQTGYENVAAECDDAKLKVESLTSQRDNEVACLRNSMGRKETLFKEMEYRAGKLELENQELMASIKELQEAGIRKAGNSSSSAKLKNKLRSLEQIHKDCAVTLKAKETEWSSQLEEMKAVVNESRSASEIKDREIKNLKFELETCYSSLMQLRLQNEEHFVMLLVLRSAISEAKLALDKNQAEICVRNKETDEKISDLMMLLELKNSALVEAERGCKEEREKSASLLRKLDSVDPVDEQKSLIQKELDRFKELLEESTKCQLHLEEKMLQVKTESEEKLRTISDAFDRANSELADRFCEENDIVFELWTWKSIAERLNDEIKENQGKRKELEASLLEQVEVSESIKQEKGSLLNVLKEKERRIQNLQQQIGLLEQKLKGKQAEASLAKISTAMAVAVEEQKSVQILEEKDKILKDLQKEIEYLELESLRREIEGAMLTQIAAERTFGLEKYKLIQLVHNKEKRLDDLDQLLASKEANLNESLVSFSSQIAKKQAELDLVHEAWEKINAAEILAKLETEEKKLMITELEETICDLQQKLELQERSLRDSKQKATDVDAELKAKRLEMKELSTQAELRLKTSGASIDELKREKSLLLEDVTTLSTEKDKLLKFLAEIDDKISKFSSEDMQLIEGLGKIMHSIESGASGLPLKEDDDLIESVKENTNTHSLAVNKSGSFLEERSPFRELNYSSH